jgi:hypothetical protein
MDVEDLTASLSGGSLAASGGAARAHGGDPQETMARWGPRGTGKGHGGSGKCGECGRGHNTGTGAL